MPKWPEVELLAACSLFKEGGGGDFLFARAVQHHFYIVNCCQFSVNVIVLETQSLAPYSLTVKAVWGRGAYLISGPKKGEQKWGGGLISNNTDLRKSILIFQPLL